MDNIFFLIIIALAILAVSDLVVGVSNDAVNFLNSALGSKAVSFKTIMIVASVGIALGAVFSSGMMEVARKGIFNPGEFYFDEIMFIFMAVMITDILLLDFFNTLGIPTSTTVSIVFELLGASVAMALIKISTDQGQLTDLADFINVSKATAIIFGILLSVVVAFSVGALVQWVSRLLLSYDYETKSNCVGAVFGGVSISSIIYFILIKGINGTAFAEMKLDFIGGVTIKFFLEARVWSIIGFNLVIWSLISYLLISVVKINIYKLIIVIGTFALALAFAGNDLVNFIGVPIAGWQSYKAWVASGLPASEFGMSVLAKKVPTPTLFLLISGIVMIVTLWFSKKARYVTDTEINLAREGESRERFSPNFLSRSIVRFSMSANRFFLLILPKMLQEKIEVQFKKPVLTLGKSKNYEMPAFDMVRAAVNLTIAGILISIATSYKLPLSTTYVTFMVAMGTSLADRAWGTESAVYRVAGVLNVIGGWFGTAIIAFLVSGAVLTIICFGRGTAIAVLLIAAILLLARNFISYNRKMKELKSEDSLRLAESSSVQGVIEESADNISKVIKRSKNIYSNVVNGLSKQDLKTLRKSRKLSAKLSDEVDNLRDHLFFFIKKLDDTGVRSSYFYISTLGCITDISQSLEYISKVSYKHVNNNHKKLKYSQLKELKEIENKLEELLNESKTIFKSRSFNQIGEIFKYREELLNLLPLKIEAQVSKIRSEETSPRNTTLYFSLLIETKDCLISILNLLEIYFNEYDSSIEPVNANRKE